MRSTLWRNLRGHARRMIATGLAVMFAVAFIAGTFIFSDTARAGFYDTYARLARGIDVSVRPPLASKAEDATPPELTPAQVAAVRAVPGIGALDARMEAALPLLGRDGRVLTNFGTAGVAVSTDSPAALRAYDLRGTAPGDGEAVVDVDTAAHQRWAIGDDVTVIDRRGGRHALRLSGLIDFGVSKRYAGESVVGLPAARITELTGDTGFREVVATSAGGVTAATLTARVAAALGAGPRVESGDQRRAELANDATSVATQFQIILLVFGAISLIVAAFVIYNTFAILLTQRVRETALLRCVGATRRQVFTLAAGEAVAIGSTASLAGVAVGAGVAYGLITLLDHVVDAGIPAGGVTVGPRSAVIGIAAGVLVTVASAALPAIRAGRVTAMAAMRDLPAARSGRRGARIARAVTGLVIVAAGAALTAVGAGAADARSGTFAVVAGGVLAFGGVLVGSPLFIGPLIAAVGALPARLAGVPGRLAVANARRNPGRAAVTSATLMIGIGLMTLFSVVLGSVRQTAADQIGAHYPVDYAMTPVAYGRDASIPTGYADALRRLPQFAAIGEIRAANATIGGHTGTLASVDPSALGTIATPTLVTGRLSDLATGAVILSTASTVKAPLGATVTVRVAGHPATLRVVGTGRLTVPGGQPVDALVSWDQMDELAGPAGDAAVLAKAAPGVTPVASRDALDTLAGTYPLVAVNSLADLRGNLDSTIRGLIALFAGLLGTAVLIALFGIANTLALSVQERGRESATVRALGLTRGQLAATLLLEALLMGLVGALVGIAYGLLYGRLVVRSAFAAIGPTVVVPWAWIAGLAVLAGGAATLAAIVPARRAARASLVAAMAET